jgi:hypothetical protein
LCKRNITPFSTTARTFLALYADFAGGLPSIQINGAVFKPCLRVGHASLKTMPFLASR